jgi:hypothetical protein
MVQKMSRALLAIALTLLAASVASSQSPAPVQGPAPPDFKVQVWGDIAIDFSARVSSYFDLRSEVETGLPAQEITDDPGRISRTQHALAKRIRAARAEARQGDFFTPTISVQFKKVLLSEMSSGTWASIMEDNPGEFRARINSSFPGEKPLSTVPPNILAALPPLPEEIEYRFLGRHLILLDTKALVILDRIPYAIASGP